MTQLERLSRLTSRIIESKGFLGRKLNPGSNQQPFIPNSDLESLITNEFKRKHNGQYDNAVINALCAIATGIPKIDLQIAAMSVSRIMQALNVFNGSQYEFWDSIRMPVISGTFLSRPRRLVAQRSR